MKKMVINADNFGVSNDYNRAVLNGCNNGFLKSASIVANGETYNAAINEIIPECPQLGVGICLNLTKGSAITKCKNLTDNNNIFNKNLITLHKLCRKKEVLKEIENEFRAQIDKIPKDIRITHVDSLDNIHAIPKIFEIACKIAEERNITFIVTHNEKYVFTFNYKYLLKPKIIFNFAKSLLLKLFTIQNKKILKNFNLKTNDYILGILYSGIITPELLQIILSSIICENILVHVKLFPCSYLRNINDEHSTDFKITQDKILEDNIIRQGFNISNYR